MGIDCDFRQLDGEEAPLCRKGPTLVLEKILLEWDRLLLRGLWAGVD